MNIGAPKTMSLPNSSSSRKAAGDGGSDQFPAGLRVLVVDDDPTCLMILEKMLRTCLYEVTKSNRAEKALSLLRENRNGYDIIISDVHMPDMDGFKLLEHVGLEMDLPVIMMSADDSKNVVMKGVTHGACDYLIKPVRMEALKNIWQHVVRRKKHEWKDIEPSGSIDEGERPQKPNEEVDYSSSANEGNWRNSKRRKEEEDEAEEKDDTSALKKPRVVWSVELHQQFMAAVDQLGVDKAVPKKILELMNVPGLTRENVASHLQKYRLYLRRLSGVSQHHAGLGNSFGGPRDPGFGSISSINGIDLQALAASGHLPAQSLASLQAAALARSLPKSNVSMPILDQRNNLFSFENPSKLRFGDSTCTNSINNDNNSNKQVNLLHGIPTTMEPKQLANFRGMNMQPNPRGRDGSSLMVQMNNGNNNGNNTHLSRLSSSPMVQQPSFSANGVFTRNELISNVRSSAYNPVAQPSPMVDFSGNQNNADKGLLQNEVTSKESRGFDPSYDIFRDLAQHKTTDNWDLQNVGLSFDSTPHVNLHGNNSSLNVQPSVLVHQGFSSGQSGLQNGNGIGNGIGNTVPNMGQQLNTFTGQNSLRVKSEAIPEISSQNMLFGDQFGQEDLLSALLKQQDGIGPVPNDFGFDGFPPLDNLPV